MADPAQRETGPQRRKVGNRPLHCCCICGELNLWGETWTYYASLKDEDDGAPIAKFCTSVCARKAGPKCENVTEAMKREAREKEYRPPKPYVEPPRPRTYADAAHDQRRDRERAARIAEAVREWRSGDA